MANLKKIKEIAKEKKIPLNAISEAIGVTPQAFSRIMRENTTTIENVEAISAFLGVSPSVFFDDTPSVSVSSVGDGNNIVGRGNIENARDIGKALDILHEQLRTKDEQIGGLIKALQKTP